MSRRRLGQLAAAVVLASGIVVVGAPPSSAATALEVQAGFDGAYSPGRAVRVRIAIVADHLVRGALDVRVTLGPSIVVTRPVEVPGGSTKELVVAVPTFGANFGGTELQVEVALRDGSGQLAEGSARVQWTPDAELVGVLPAAGALATVPDTSALAVDAGTARFVAVDELDLAEPGAIDAFDMLAVTSRPPVSDEPPLALTDANPPAARSSLPVAARPSLENRTEVSLKPPKNVPGALPYQPSGNGTVTPPPPRDATPTHEVARAPAARVSTIVVCAASAPERSERPASQPPAVKITATAGTTPHKSSGRPSRRSTR